MTFLPAVQGLLTVTVPVTVTVPPTGMSPVHKTPVVPIVSVPEVAVSFAVVAVSSAVFGVMKLT